MDAFGRRPLPRQVSGGQESPRVLRGFVYFSQLATTKEPTDRSQDQKHPRHEFQPPTASQKNFRKFCAQVQSPQSAPRQSHVSPPNSRVNLLSSSPQRHHQPPRPKQKRHIKPTPACPLFQQNEPLPRVASHGKRLVLRWPDLVLSRPRRHYRPRLSQGLHRRPRLKSDSRLQSISRSQRRHLQAERSPNRRRCGICGHLRYRRRTRSDGPSPRVPVSRQVSRHRSCMFSFKSQSLAMLMVLSLLAMSARVISAFTGCAV